MHEGEVAIDDALVKRLIASQFPEYADRPLELVRSTGTVNAIYRLGDDLCVRLPRVANWAGDLAKELEWLPRLAPRLSLMIPASVGHGHATADYPFTWAIYRWIDGKPYDGAVDERTAAEQLAGFVTELRAMEVGPDAPSGGRPPLRELDSVTRKAIAAARDVIDAGAAVTAWERALEAPPWDGVPVWIHTDLLRPNVLLRDGRLHAVIDFGGVGVGDPAADVVAAWAMFGPKGRGAYRAALDPDQGVWERARGYALHQAALIIPYYAVTNPGFVVDAKRTVEQLLIDP
ncbi:MAG: aminoglycoside phosphotransferase family protein [Candidatus Dormibacteraeota bacterium]|nr:aminoglycoside phosphotransferase family protein [Candidatus Dormibacteraeota bacterium]